MINLHEIMGPSRDRTRDPWICSQTRICCQTFPTALHSPVKMKVSNHSVNNQICCFPRFFQLGLDARNPIFRVYDQVRFISVYLATETSWNVETAHSKCNCSTTKALIRLHGCAGWSLLLLFACNSQAPRL